MTGEARVQRRRQRGALADALGKLARWALMATVVALTALPSCVLDEAPQPFGATPPGPGATVRYDLAHKPLPAIPLPIDTATWSDPTSRTGLRINASLVAPTLIERQVRQRFSEMEGWGTFGHLTVSFDVPSDDPAYRDYDGPALDLATVRARHQGDDYDFADDAVYLLNLRTGVPVVLDLGAGNFDYTLRDIDKYWANDTRASERNLLFETIDESQGGAIEHYEPRYDTDFDGVLDRPNLGQPDACPGPDPVCDDPASGDSYRSAACVARRRERDRCIADNLLTWYERETDTLVMRPLLPLDEMTQYAVVITDRLVDGRGHAVKSPFESVYHAAQRAQALRVANIIDDPRFAAYFSDVSGTGLGRIAFLWSFTTQPTVDDMRRLRDGLYGVGPFARWAEAFPPAVEMQRMVGLTGGLAEGATDQDGWEQSSLGVDAGCPAKATNLFKLDVDGLSDAAIDLLVNGLDFDPGPGVNQLLRKLDAVSHIVIGTYKTPFLLEGGPSGTDPNAGFSLNYLTGEGFETEDTVQFMMFVPKETAQHQQPFDVNIFGHGYTSQFFEMIVYAGTMAEHGIATVGINAMGHGLVFDDDATRVAARAAVGGVCFAPALDAMLLGRTRDLNRSGVGDSGGDFWSAYLFHTRDAVRQSVLDHIQLVRIMRSFGSGAGVMACRDDSDPERPVRACDFDGDGNKALNGDFDGNGVIDTGGSEVKYATWGESLGGILSGIHGAIDAYVTSAIPGSGGGGLTDIGLRSFQGGVVEAVILRMMGPLLVAVPAAERKTCDAFSRDKDRCTVCGSEQTSIRWVLPDVNGTGEVEVACVEQGTIAGTTVLVRNLDNDEVKCARVGDDARFRVGLPSTAGDRVVATFWEGIDRVESYEGCRVLEGTPLRHVVDTWSAGRFTEGTPNGAETATCEAELCSGFQGTFFAVDSPLTAPGGGYGLTRQAPELRRFLSLAQGVIDPADPISYAPYYALKPMTDPAGQRIAPHAMLSLNTIGDMNVPLNAGIAQARAAGALPFLRPDQAESYPEYRDYVTPRALFDALGGRTPNQDLIDRHVIEGITRLARHPSAAGCRASANAAPATASWIDFKGEVRACYPSGCTADSEASSDTRVCFSNTRCDVASGNCVPQELSAATCDEALWDSDDLDEGKQRYLEQASAVPHRLARLTASAQDAALETVWAPRLQGIPYASDGAGYQPQKAPEGRLTALLNAYIVPQGEHTFINGEPCQSFDHGTYLGNVVARFFQSDGTDLYYLSHPASHHCMATADPSCPYALDP
jgi:hypothetical protein